MKTVSVRILSPSRRLMARPGDDPVDKVADAAIPSSAYCRKRGIYGECFVDVARGELPSLTERETHYIRQNRRLLVSAPGRRKWPGPIKTMAPISQASDASFQKILIESLESPKEVLG